MKNFNSETELIAWPVDWNKRSRLACFFSPVPFVGDDWKLHKNANKIPRPQNGRGIHAKGIGEIAVRS